MPLKLNVPLPSKGVVVDRPAEFVDPRSVVNDRNMEYNRGIIRKRVGTLAMGSSLAERIQRTFELQVGASTRLIRVGLTKVEEYNKGTDAWANIAHSALTGGASDMVSYAFPTLSGSKIATFTNNKDNIRKITSAGNDADLGGSPPKCKFMRSFGGYLLLGYITSGGTFPNRVQWPDTGNPESWTPGSGSNAGSSDLLDDDGEIMGFGLFGSYVTVHMWKSIYLIQKIGTSAIFRFDRRPTGIGCVAEATIQNLPTGEQIFLAADGIHIFNGVTAPLIDSPIQDELREGMNPSVTYKCQSIMVQELNEYWVSVPMGSDTEPQTVYRYNYLTQQIYKDTRTNLTALGLFLNTQGGGDTWDNDSASWDSDTTNWDSTVNLSLQPVVILGDSSGVATKRSANTNNDNGVAVDAMRETKDYNALDFGLPDMDRLMRWKGIELWAKGTAVNVYYSSDGGTTWMLAKAATLNSYYPADSSPLNIYFDVVSSTLRLRFQNSDLGSSFTIKKLQLEATPREARK